eukprot:GDKJ01059056.1.p1 GENE.GDKJ01059056.1~~GDKJ01059056.1.p1  ORF type:complete len:549 (+),score=73.05 GDKJ01059056.1:24-1670(+)
MGGSNSRPDLELGIPLSFLPENHSIDLLNYIADALNEGKDPYRTESNFSRCLYGSRCNLNLQKSNTKPSKKFSAADLRVQHIVISVFGDDLPGNIKQELSALLEDWVSFSQVLLRTYLFQFFSNAPRFFATGDIFEYSGVKFKVMSMYPSFGVITRETDFLALPMLLSTSKTLTRVEVVALQPCKCHNSNESYQRISAYEEAVALRARNEGSFFRSHILPMFSQRKNPAESSPSYPLGIHTRVGEVLTTATGLSFVVIALDPYEAIGGMLTAQSLIYCAQEPIEEVSSAYFMMDAAEVPKISRMFRNQALTDGRVEYLYKFLRTFLKSYPQIGILNRPVLPKMVARILRTPRQVVNRGLITGNTSIEIQFITHLSMTLHAHIDIFAIFQQRLNQIYESLSSSDPRRPRIRNLRDNLLPRLQGQDPLVIIRTLNAALSEIVTKKGLTQAEIELFTLSWPYKKPTGGTEERSCSICLTEFEEGVLIRCLRCTHQYHDECIKTWLQNAFECPNCHLPVKGGTGEEALLEDTNGRAGADGEVSALARGGGFT